jgi:hypothetical protein
VTVDPAIPARECQASETCPPLPQGYNQAGWQAAAFFFFFFF